MTDKPLHCMMCRKSSDEVANLIAGPDTNICDECIAELAAIVADEDDDWRKALIERLSAIKP